MDVSDDEGLDGWLAEHHRELVDGVAAALDVEAGLAEAVRCEGTADAGRVIRRRGRVTLDLIPAAPDDLSGLVAGNPQGRESDDPGVDGPGRCANTNPGP